MMTGRAKGKAQQKLLREVAMEPRGTGMVAHWLDRNENGDVVFHGEKKDCVISDKVMKAFHRIAGNIIDTQIEYKPGQDGRWDVVPLPDGTPRIKFSIFEPDTIFILRSANHNVVELGLEATALAISECAMNWVANSAEQGGHLDAAFEAGHLYAALHEYIFHVRQSRLTSEEKLLIHRYND